MSGVVILHTILTANAALTDVVPADRIIGEDLPDKTDIPAISIETVSSVDRKVVAPGALRRVTERVQVTVHAKDSTQRLALIGLVRRAAAGVLGHFDEFTRVSVQTEGQGPDFTGDTGIRMRMQDFMVSFNENTGASIPVLPFNPAGLFAGGEVGCWYDPSDLASMFQDVAGTLPAVVDAPVARINDKSGGLRHAFVSATSARPMLRRDGARFYLEFDGIDDYLRAIFTIANPFTRISAIRQITWADQDRIFGAAATISNGELIQRTASPQIALLTSTSSAAANNTGAPIGVDAVVSEHFSAAGQTLAINNNNPTTAGAGTGAPGGVTLGASRFNTNNANIRFYGTVMIARDLTGDETLNARYFVAEKGGVTL